MKSNNAYILPVLAVLFSLASCEVVGGIFEAGFYTAIIGVVLVILLVVWLLRKFRGRH